MLNKIFNYIYLLLASILSFLGFGYLKEKIEHANNYLKAKIEHDRMAYTSFDYCPNILGKKCGRYGCSFF